MKDKKDTRSKHLIPAKKGEVRNPYGRHGKDGTKGKQNVSTILNDFLSCKTKDNDLTKLQEIMLNLIKQSKEGNLRAIEMLMDRIDGKPVQKTENKNLNMSSKDYLDILDGTKTIDDA